MQVELSLLDLWMFFLSLCRFGFVKQLKKHLDCVLGPLIDDEIEKHSSEIQVNSITQQGDQTLVEKITDKIIHSKLYVIEEEFYFITIQY